MTRKYDNYDLGLLYGKSAGMCNYCRIPVFQPTEDGSAYVNVGEIAHDLPHSPNGPRGEEVADILKIDKYIPNNTYKNLILLCRNDHKRIDSDPSYDSYKVQQLKLAHEEWVYNIFQESVYSSDYLVVRSILNNIDMQAVYRALEWSPGFISEEIFQLTNFSDILLSYEPLKYPFTHIGLREATNNILRNWSELKLLLNDPYFYRLLPTNREFKNNLISNDQFDMLKNICFSLEKSLYEWLEIVRYLN
ncbi:hypothetical protein [Acinetobacter pittii]|uniref:HNH endonuclease n=1 Tax=Acinetobacter pittii TaxID=48296 RepID=A0A6H0G024_ACIPI|nr:hypothetical protein [Acinetobacter pittii]QIT19977.1 hypothetical protein G8E09_19395 [Acinetobacter pittii]